MGVPVTLRRTAVSGSEVRAGAAAEEEPGRPAADPISCNERREEQNCATQKTPPVATNDDRTERRDSERIACVFFVCVLYVESVLLNVFVLRSAF